MSIMADVDVEAMPTASGENLRAASHQYAKPRTEVTPVVAISEPALTSMTLLAVSHCTGDVDSDTFTKRVFLFLLVSYLQSYFVAEEVKQPSFCVL